MDELSVVEIEINHHCNLACSYCPNRDHERIEKGEMSLEDYESILLQLVEIGFKGRISHEFYGEPTLHTQFEKIVSLTKKHLPHIKLELYTNATKMPKARLLDLMERGIDQFIVTKHEGIKNLELEKYWDELTQEQKDKILLKGFTEIYMTNRGGLLENVGGEKQPLLPCQIPSFLMTITVKGNVLPCFEDFFQNHEMGNVFKTPLKEIWNSPEYVKLRKDLRHGLRHVYKTCENCNRIQTKRPDNFNTN
ncbi:MAG: SPASM domain-containing protein [Halobacteriovoraceae bacterium]|nr:SPASM domain-containing protein [Halobacteriovoraceae bacterium]